MEELPVADDVLEVLNKAQGKEPALGGVLLRDAATIVAALALWGGADAWAGATGLGLAMVTAVGASMVAGWSIASLLHEWGHYTGAKVAGAVAPRVQVSGMSFFRYNFDLENNSLGQFTAMSLGGNLAHWATFAAAFVLLPMSTPAQATFVGTAFAFAVFASVIEFPIIARTASRRVRPLEAFAHIDKAFITKHYVIGGVGGLLFLAFA